MEPEKSPARRWAEHRYETRQQEWQEELGNDPPDWSRLDELEQELRGIEAYLRELELEDLIGGS